MVTNSLVLADNPPRLTDTLGLYVPAEVYVQEKDWLVLVVLTVCAADPLLQLKVYVISPAAVPPTTTEDDVITWPPDKV